MENQGSVATFTKRGLDRLAVTYICLQELERADLMLEPAKIGLGSRPPQVIDDDDLIAAGEVTTRRVDPNESGATCN
jgi:hypothetical protein